MAAAAPLTVAVIGAGVAGMAAARAIRSESHRVVIFEKSDRLGGTWVYDSRVDSDDPNRKASAVHSSLYHSLRTNLPRQLMGFSDHPFSTRKNQDPRTFPGHDEVLQFLTEFAQQFRLTELIRFGAEVVRVEPSESWAVEWKQNGLNSVEAFDAVVVCNGHHTQPRWASFPGMEKWPGRQMHSHNYRVPDPFQDQIVVVIGGGPSAIDISMEISSVAKQVHISSRDPNIRASKLDDVKDNMWQHSKIDHVDENGQAFFQDGACIQADIILHCTGYKYEFPFLKTEGIVSVEDNRVGPLYKHVFPPKLAPNLAFVGLTYQSALFFMIDLQAKWVAHVLSGKASLPSVEAMLAEVEEYYQHMEMEGIHKHHTHCLNHQFEYLDWIATQVGLQGVVERIQSIYMDFYKLVTTKGKWVNRRQWKPSNEFQEYKLEAKYDVEGFEKDRRRRDLDTLPIINYS